MTERDYAIRSFKEITLNAAQHTEERMDAYCEAKRPDLRSKTVAFRF